MWFHSVLSIEVFPEDEGGSFAVSSEIVITYKTALCRNAVCNN